MDKDKTDIENVTVRRKLNTFIRGTARPEFGDYILFQEYESVCLDRDHYRYEVSRPVMAIYLGGFVADQTIGFNYVRWNNDRHTVYVTNEYVTAHPVMKQVCGIERHIEWDDYIDILGHWSHKPNWREIIASYRLQNTEHNIGEDDIDWVIR